MSSMPFPKAIQRLKSHCAVLPIKILIASFTLGIIATFTASHLFIQHSDRKVLSSYLQSITNTTKQLNTTIAQIFKAFPNDNDQICTKADLKKMRSFLWNNSQLKEIARIADNSVLCSASWGMLAPPINLPAPTKVWEHNHYQHWRDIKDIIQGSMNVNMIANQNTLIVISPYAYTSILPSNEHIGFIISTMEQNYVSIAVGPLPPKSVLENTVSLHTMLTHQSCDNALQGICITVYNCRSGIFAKDRTYILFVVLVSIVISLLIYTSLLSFMGYRNSMRKALKHALDNKELFVVFQPQINLLTGEVVGMEALARWHDEKFGHVPPDVFITIAEERGFMPKLSRFIIERALNDAGPLLKKYPHLQLSINLSMADLTNSLLLDFIDDHREKHSVQVQQLVFEITENSAAGFENIESSVEQFESRGYAISLDDFGTGYANLSWLSKIKASEIKVDRSFTHMIGSPDDNHIKTLKAIFKLVKSLNITTVFEGIETQEQADYIISNTKNAIGQGWLYAKPMPIDQLRHFINIKENAPTNLPPMPQDPSEP